MRRLLAIVLFFLSLGAYCRVKSTYYQTAYDEIDLQLELLHRQLKATRRTQETPELQRRWQENRNQLEKGDSTTAFIPPEVLSYYNTPGFILVKQHPRQYDEAVCPRYYQYHHGQILFIIGTSTKTRKFMLAPFFIQRLKRTCRTRTLPICCIS